MQQTLEKLRESIEKAEPVDWGQIASLQAIDIAQAGEAFKDEMLGLMSEGERRYGVNIKSVEFGPDGSIAKVEFHEPRTTDEALAVSQ